jgi:sulfonate transport system ATP-binding protein
MLVLDHIDKTYANGVHALQDVSYSVGPGEILAIVGGSGCGKSTLLRAICGLDAPNRGRVLLDGQPITAPHEKIGIIFQEPRLLPWLTVADNVGFGLHGIPRAERRARITDALVRVGLSDKAHVWPRELSGGQAQRVAIARALVPRPEVLLLDEPFSALDAFTRVDLQDHLLDLWTDGRPTLILVTHDVEAAEAGTHFRGNQGRPATSARSPVGGIRFRAPSRAGGARPVARPDRRSGYFNPARRGKLVVKAGPQGHPLSPPRRTRVAA